MENNEEQKKNDGTEKDKGLTSKQKAICVGVAAVAAVAFLIIGDAVIKESGPVAIEKEPKPVETTPVEEETAVTEETVAETTDETAMTEDIAEVAEIPANATNLQLMEQIIDMQGVEDENIMLSPTSLNMALSLVAQGAEGQSKESLDQFIGEKDIASLYKHSQEVDGMTFANSVWFKEGLEPNEEYVSKVKDTLGAEVFQEPFCVQTVEKVNNWVSENTDGMVDRIIEEFDPDNRVLLLNTTLFDMKWLETVPDESMMYDTFTNSKGESEDAHYISTEERIYLENDKATGFMKPYTEDGYYFVGILPKEDDMTFAEADIQGLIDNKQYCDVNVMLPEFSFESEFKNLKSDITALGFGDAMNLGDTNMVNGDEDFEIGSIMQKSKIELTQEGTKAAAVTGIMVDTAAFVPTEVKEVYLTKPFMFAIYDELNKEVVFLGKVNTIH